jgi:hypothetical protein
MKQQLRSLAFVALFAALAAAASHHNLNGTWVLVPSRSDFGGAPAIETGTLTIYDRQHNIYVSRTFGLEGEEGAFSYNFSLDGSENSTIREGKTLKTKAKWDGDVLKVTITRDNVPTVERYSLEPDGTLTLLVERPDHRVLRLTFVRS